MDFYQHKNSIGETLELDPEKGLRNLEAFVQDHDPGDLLKHVLLLRMDFSEIASSPNYANLTDRLLQLEYPKQQQRLLAEHLLISFERIQEFVNNLKGSENKVEVLETLKALDQQDRQEKMKAVRQQAMAILEEISPAEEKSAILPKPEQSVMEDVSVDQPVIFQCTHLRKTYPSTQFDLGGINLELRLGEITGIVGENATGKSTVLRMIAGELLPTSGEYAYPYLQKGETGKKNWKKIKRKIAFLPQELPRWYGSLRENIQYEAAMHGIRGPENDEATDYIIHRLGLAEHEKKSWSQLSGGYKLRFSLAKALVWYPNLLVLDEPLAYLDVKAQQVVLDDLRRMADGIRYPLSIVLSSQHIHELEKITDNIIILRENQVFFNDKLENIKYDSQIKVFEVEADCSIHDLEMALNLIPQVRIEQKYHQYVIYIPERVTSTQIIEKLAKAAIPVTYFRDISHSIKKYFI